MNRKLFATVAAFALLLSLPALAGDPLQTTKGTMQLGGTGTFGVDMYMPESGDSVTGYALGLSPKFGYFVIDNLEILASVGFAGGFGDMYENSGMSLGFGAGAEYFLAMGSMNMYFGLAVGMGFVIPETGDTTKELILMVPVGVLFPFNSHVALDVGLQFSFNMGLDDQGNWMNLPIGYFGMQAFF